MTRCKVNGKKSSVLTDVMNGVDPSTIESLYKIDWMGSADERVLGELRGDNVLVEEQFSKAHGVGVGDSFQDPDAHRR